MLALADRAVEDAVIGDDAPERVEHRVEDERLQGGVFVPFGCRDALYDGFEYLLYSLARFARGAENLLWLASQQVHDLILHFVDHGRIHVDLIEHGHDRQVVFDGKVEVGNGLGLNALRGVHDQ